MLKEKIRSLVEGSLGHDESLACLSVLSTSGESLLNQETFAQTIEAVRACAVAGASSLFADAGKLIDCCGTGGSGLSHYNTSTTVAFILAAAGLKVTKFGNRAASSNCGSFDLLDALAIGATLPLPALPEVLEETNLVFLFAPQFYPSLAALAPLRKKIGQPTVFNFIGPVLNPASPVYRLIGVPSEKAQTLVASYLHGEGRVEHALVVRATSGLDELDVYAPNIVARVRMHFEKKQGANNHPTLELETIESAFGIKASKLQGKKDGQLTVHENLAIFDALISGQMEETNYYHALVCLNAAGAMQAGGLTSAWEEGLKLASELLKKGVVKEKLKQYQSQFK